MGWTWISDYEWGAIPYHYGTWVADRNVGWVWIPGRVWAPSWVVFRTGPDYIGWAPVPTGYSVGMSIDFGGLRVAEQVPASRPLPSDKPGVGKQNGSSADASQLNKKHQGGQ
jgi:hypothetical protein